MSLTKNLKALTNLPPRPIITWDKHARIQRNKEIWENKESIVHRLPKHYQKNYWRDLLSDITPVHYKPPQYRFYWDTHQKREIEAQNYPILPEHCPEQDQGIWGGEGIIKGYKESRPFTRKKILPRHWVPKLWFPNTTEELLYSEVLDKYMKITVTYRALRLIDDFYGLDYYLLETKNLDLGSNLAITLKRNILIKLAKKDYYPEDKERYDYIEKKYAKYLLPLEEAEWYGLGLNEACRKLQDLEDNSAPTPLKYIYEQGLVDSLRQKDVMQLEDDKFAKPQKSLFGEKLFGSVVKRFSKEAR